MTLKDRYQELKDRLDEAVKNTAELVGKKKVAESQIARINKDIETITKGKDVGDVLNAVSKEIEVRLELVNTKLSKIEKEIEVALTGSASVVDNEDLLEGVIDEV